MLVGGLDSKGRKAAQNGMQMYFFPRRQQWIYWFLNISFISITD